jgi:hypothetical protein
MPWYPCNFLIDAGAKAADFDPRLDCRSDPPGAREMPVEALSRSSVLPIWVAHNRERILMARPANSEKPKPSAGRSRSGFDKMQMNHRRTREQIQRIRTEEAGRVATGKPVHPKVVHK